MIFFFAVSRASGLSRLCQCSAWPCRNMWLCRECPEEKEHINFQALYSRPIMRRIVFAAISLRNRQHEKHRGPLFGSLVLRFVLSAPNGTRPCELAPITSGLSRKVVFFGTWSNVCTQEMALFCQRKMFLNNMPPWNCRSKSTA